MEKASEQTIYIRLLEGVETLVPCTGVHKYEMIYEIIENPYLDLVEDATSIWEFFPGDLVRCEMKEPDTLIAVELMSSKLTNRKIYSLLYHIVFSLGKLESSALIGYEAEFKKLCDQKEYIRQKDHPIVAAWIEANWNQIKNS